MLLPYFTFLHWLVVAFFIIIFLLVMVLSFRVKNINLAAGIIFSTFLFSSLGCFLGVMILEKYTKKGELSKVKQRRILFNETFTLKGFVINKGKFPLKYCKLDVKLVNEGYSQAALKGNMFKSSGFNIFGSKDETKERPNTVNKTFVLFKERLNPNLSKQFTVTLKYPPYFKNTYLNYKVNCH